MHFVIDIKANLIVGKHDEKAKAEEQRALYLHNLRGLASIGLPGHMANVADANARTDEEVVVASASALKSK